MTDSAAHKAELRRTLRSRRDALTPGERASAAHRIAEQLALLIVDRDLIAAFSATRNEVDLREFYVELLAAGRSLCFPRVESASQMVFAQVTALDQLQPGAFGIAEPPGPPVALDAIDVFLVPGLAFDRSGARLGFGGGFYDRALEARREVTEKVPLLLGIGYSWQVLETDLPVDEWDVPLDSVVTETGVLRALRGSERGTQND